jgi:deoxyadenosine/deoxycytidine kinase
MVIICCIDGNIAAGKTTLLDQLKNIGYQIFQEDLVDWGTLLDRFYTNKTRWMCTLQLSILHSMYSQFMKIKNSSPQNSIIFVERCPKSSLIFVENGFREGFIDAEEKRLIMKMYDVLKWTPDVHFYINTSPQTCFERMKLRNRSCEKDVSRDYLEMIHNEYFKQMTSNTIVLNNNPLYTISNYIQNHLHSTNSIKK